MFRIRTLLWALVAGVALSFAVVPAAEAEAKSGRVSKGKKRSKGKARKANAPKADTKAISELMGDYKFGISPKNVLSILFKRIDEKYKDKIAETTDVYQQDQLRRQATREKNKISASLIEFKGQKTGWDVSIIDDEFGHKNGESMLVFWDRDTQTGVEQRRFFFFIDGELYKMYIAFDAKMFPPGKRQFAYFQKIMESRYGSGELVWDEDRYGSQRIKHLHWKNDKYYLRAINRMEFYGTFCLALSNPAVETWIADRREQNNPQIKKDDAIIRAVTQPQDTPMSLDEANSGAVDAIIGGGK